MRIHYRIILLGLSLCFLVILSTISAAQNTVNTCVSCHHGLEDELQEATDLFSNDVHNIGGVSCAGCHGGNPAEQDAELAMSPKEGFIGTPSALEIPEFCGRCHSDPVYMRLYNPAVATDQLEKYWSSHHGELNQNGDKKVAHCVSCHGVHDIRPSGDPLSAVHAKNVPQTCSKCHSDNQYMAPYGISTDQYEAYRHSVHGEALLLKNDTGAPACNDCHGNHAATPPGISSIGRVCFQCHLAEGELFSASPHKAAWDELGVPECSFCHGHHAVHALADRHVGVGEESICIECHAEGDNGYEAAQEMHQAIVGLKDRYQEANTLIEEAEQKGIEVSDQVYQLREVRQSLINVRKLIHAFDPEKVGASTEEAMQSANDIHQAGLQSVAEVKNRRAGVLVFSIVTLFLALVLYLGIKKKEQNQP